MRRIFTHAILFSLLAICLPTSAQVNYAFSSATGIYTSISGTSPALTAIPTTRTATDEGYSSNIPIGFNFNYNGTVYTNLNVSTNGFISLSSSATTPTNAGATNSLNGGPIGNTFLRPVIAPLWDDLDIQAVENLQFTVSGASPNRVFTMQWSDVKWPATATAASISFQAKLYETSNIIQFVYQQIGATSTPSATASIGITATATGAGNFISLQNTTTSPTISRTAENPNLTQRPASGQVYTFTPSTITNDVVLSNIYTMGKINTFSGNPNVVSAYITNISNTSYTNYSATLNVTGANTFTNTKVVPSLAPGTSAIVTFDSYTAPATGTNLVNVTLPSDNDNATNTITVSQLVTTNRAGYAYTTTPFSGLGSSTPTDFVAKFKNAHTSTITQITTYFASSGREYQAAIWDASGEGGRPGNILWTSSPALTTNVGAVNIDVSPAVTHTGDYYVGIRQTTTNPVTLGFEYENPTRSETFFVKSQGASTWTDVSNNNGAIFRYMIEVQGVSSLPAKTSLLTGLHTENKNVLSWTTLREENNKGFSIERSTNGTDFKSIGFINSKAVDGNSNEAINYTFEDNTFASSINYYRTGQIDKDGKITYSNTVLVKASKTINTSVTINPNPVSSIMNIAVTATQKNKVNFIIADLQGRIILQQLVQLVAGENNVRINTANLSAGSYILKTITLNGSETSTTKFLKQ